MPFSCEEGLGNEIVQFIGKVMMREREGEVVHKGLVELPSVIVVKMAEGVSNEAGDEGRGGGNITEGVGHDGGTVVEHGGRQVKKKGSVV